MLKEYQGKTYEFPDDATPEEITSVLKSLEQPQQSGVGEDILEKAMSAPGDALSGIYEGLTNLPSALGYAQEHPLSALKTFGVGGLESLGQMYNLPFKFGKYLSEKNILPYSEQLLKLYPKVMIPEEKFSEFEKKLNIGETPEEQTIKSIGSLALPLKMIKGKALPARVAAESAFSSATSDNPFTGPLAFEVAPRMAEKTLELAQKGTKAGIRATAETKAALFDYPKYAQQLEEATKQATRASDEFNLQQKSLGKTNEAIQEHYSNRLNNALKFDEDANKGMADSLIEAVNRIDSQVSNLYNAVIPESAPKEILTGEKGFQIFKNITDSLIKEIKPIKGVLEEGIETSDEKSLINGLEKAEKLNSISTKDLLSFYKTSQQLSNKFKSKAWQEANGFTDAQRNNFNDAAKQFDKLTDKLSEVLNAINPEITANLAKAKDYFKTYKAPLYERPEYWSAIKKGRIVNDILKDTNSEQLGAKLLRNLILDNPKFNKYALSNVLNKNPENLIKLGGKEAYSDFVKANPEVNFSYQGLKGLQRGAEKIKSLQPEAGYIKGLQSKLAGKALKLSDKEIETLNTDEAKKVISIIDEEIKKLEELRESRDLTKRNQETIENKIKPLQQKRAKLITKFGLGAVAYQAYELGSRTLKNLFL